MFMSLRNNVSAMSGEKVRPSSLHTAANDALIALRNATVSPCSGFRYRGSQWVNGFFQTLRRMSREWNAVWLTRSSVVLA